MSLKSTAWVMATLMCGTSIAGVVARPSTKAVDRGLISLEATVPKSFGDWTELPESNTEVVNPQAQEYLNKLYSQILTRTYVSKDGYRIMLSMAGGLSFGDIKVHRLTTSMGPRNEPVTYWMADHVVSNQWERRMIEIRTILTGQIPDGLPFRISSIDRDSEHAFATQQKFAADMMTALPPITRRR